MLLGTMPVQLKAQPPRPDARRLMRSPLLNVSITLLMAPLPTPLAEPVICSLRPTPPPVGLEMWTNTPDIRAIPLDRRRVAGGYRVRGAKSVETAASSALKGT